MNELMGSLACASLSHVAGRVRTWCSFTAWWCVISASAEEAVQVRATKAEGNNDDTGAAATVIDRG